MRSLPTLEASEPGTSLPPIEVPRVADDPCGGGGVSPRPARKLHPRGVGGNRGGRPRAQADGPRGNGFPPGVGAGRETLQGNGSRAKNDNFSTIRFDSKLIEGGTGG